MGAGDDHIAGTEDDFQRDLTEYHYDWRQDPVYMLSRADAGDDGDYFTGDDVMRVQRFYDWDGVGLQRLYNTDAGADGAIDTGDDFDRDASRRVYDPDTDELLGVCDQDVGGDETAFTGDDVIVECRRFVPLTGEELTLISIGAGADGDWLTDDDELDEEYSRTLLDADGAVIRREVHMLAGDGTATPSAGTLLEYTDYVRDANHLLLEWRSYNADDTGIERGVYTSDAEGFVRSEDIYRAGDDDLHDSPDDFHFTRMAWFWL